MPGALNPDRIRTGVAVALQTARMFVSWWLGQLRDLVPEAARRWFGAGHDTLFVRVADHEILGYKSSGEIVFRLPAIASEPSPPGPVERSDEADKIILTLPQATVLRRIVELPLAAERELGAVMSFEVDRLTPFPADQIYQSIRVRERDTVRKILRVELGVAPKSIVDASLNLLDAHGLTITDVVVEGTDANAPLDFLPQSYRRLRRSWRAEPWKPILVASAVLLVLGILGLLFQAESKADALAAEVASMRQVGEKGEALRGTIEAASTIARFLPDRQALPRATEVVDALARNLPDDAWVFDLELTESEVRIGGFSANVSNLIERLQQVPFFGKPELRSPVLHGSGSAGDRFDIAVSLKP